MTTKAPSGAGVPVLGVPAPSLGCGAGDDEATRRGRGTLLGALASLRTMQDGKVTITGKQIVLDCFAELVEAMQPSQRSSRRGSSPSTTA